MCEGKGTLWVYEGNTSGDNAGSQSNGDGAFLKKRPYKLIMGIARPAYPADVPAAKSADEARAKATKK